MREEIVTFTIRVQGREVYTATNKPGTNWGACYFDIPPGVIPADYKQVDILIERKEGD